jgi:hypothetical protein
MRAFGNLPLDQLVVTIQVDLSVTKRHYQRAISAPQGIGFRQSTSQFVLTLQFDWQSFWYRAVSLSQSATPVAAYGLTLQQLPVRLKGVEASLVSTSKDSLRCT